MQQCKRKKTITTNENKRMLKEVFNIQKIASIQAVHINE